MNTTIFMNKTPEVDIERDHDGYDHLLSAIRKSFGDATASKEPLFTTSADTLYDIFLNNLPEEARQHYNCRSCRHWMNRYGGLVTISDNGTVLPIMFMADIPDFFRDAVDEVIRAIIASKVTGVFLTSDKHLGVEQSNGWYHMYVNSPKHIIHNNRIHNEFQTMAQKKQDYLMLLNAFTKYQKSTIETAVNLLHSNTLYRSEKVLGIAEWFLNVKTNAEMLNGKQKSNYIWKMSATAPAGFCHVSSSMIGTLLDDIEEGMGVEAVKRRFAEKMNPLQYQRPQVAPGAQNIARAEEIVAKLGIENSLKRRFARMYDLKLTWAPHPEKHTPAKTTGIFSSIKAKEESRPKKPTIVADGGTMTWDKFQRTVLPNAKKIEMHIPYGPRSYAALVTAEDPSAPPIVQWDSEENRNPVSWYLYSGDSYPTDWNLPREAWTEVTGITLQPNLWQSGFEHQGHGVFFILKGCKDTRNTSSGLFPEILRGELREVRATIEAFSKSNKLSGYEEANACGRLLQSGRAWTNCELRVTTTLGVTRYKLDRWD